MRSDVFRNGIESAPARSLLRADGLTDEDLEKPFIGIANSWNEIDNDDNDTDVADNATDNS